MKKRSFVSWRDTKYLDKEQCWLIPFLSTCGSPTVSLAVVWVAITTRSRLVELKLYVREHRIPKCSINWYYHLHFKVNIGSESVCGTCASEHGSANISKLDSDEDFELVNSPEIDKRIVAENNQILQSSKVGSTRLIMLLVSYCAVIYTGHNL